MLGIDREAPCLAGQVANKARIDTRAVEVGAADLASPVVRPVDMCGGDCDPARTGDARDEASIDARAVEVGAADHAVAGPSTGVRRPVDISLGAWGEGEGQDE